MKLLLIGYGKLGRAVEEAVAGYEDIELTDIITREQASLLEDTDRWRGSGAVALELTGPTSAYQNILACLEAGIPVVCGSTGWYEQLPDAEARCRALEGGLLVASNFAPGVGLMHTLTRHLAEFFDRHPQYGALMSETHHTAKLDAPSGTALTLATEAWLPAQNRLQGWRTATPGSGQAHTGALPIISHRLGHTVGEHSLTIDSGLERLTITHQALDRRVFAEGALAACRFMEGRKGIYSMADVVSARQPDRRVKAV